MKLVMLPCAGGTSLMFQELVTNLPRIISPKVIDYSGHGRRVQEPLLDTYSSLIEDVLNEMKKENVFDDEPYAILGYSMGAVISSQILDLLGERQLPLPDHLFLCASPPIERTYSKKLTAFSNRQLYDYLLALGGTSEELLNDKAFQAYYFPIIEADLRALANCPSFIKVKQTVPATVLYGTSDSHSREDVLSWQDFIERCAFFEITGGHFFINQKAKEMAEVIGGTLVG